MSKYVLIAVAALGCAEARQASTRIQTLRGAGDVLKRLSAEPPPPSLAKAKADEVKKYNRWLAQASRQLLELASRWEKKSAETRATCKKETCRPKIQQLNESVNLQYLRLQEKMQDQNRQYTLISNIMKTKHDTARNAINNIR